MVKDRHLAIVLAIVLVGVEAFEKARLKFIPENGGSQGIQFQLRKDGTRDEH